MIFDFLIIQSYLLHCMSDLYLENIKGQDFIIETGDYPVNMMDEKEETDDEDIQYGINNTGKEDKGRVKEIVDHSTRGDVGPRCVI